MVKLGAGNYRLIFLSTLIFVMASIGAFGQVPSNAYVNDSGTYNKGTGNVSFTFNTGGIRVNLDLSEDPIHIFEAQSGPSNQKWIVEYNSSNSTGYLLKLRVWDEAGTAGDKIQQFDCGANTFNDVCDNGCGNFNFRDFNNFTVMFNSVNNTFNIRLGQSDIVRASGSLCQGNNSIGNIIFAPNSDSGIDQFTVDSNLVTANNRAPSFTGNFLNITFPEDTNHTLNLSGNFSDLDAQNLTFGYSDLENISIVINQSSGVATLIPPSNFNGLRYAKFFANDSQNITYSNNITINITPVNDAPVLLNAVLNNTDFLNRKNGSLVIELNFTDIDLDLMQGNETFWYINGTENLTFRNRTAITSGNISKNQNWTFSARVFDGTNFSNFLNSSSIIIQNIAPTHSIPAVTSNDDNNRKNGTLTCNNQSTADLDSDIVSNFIRWYKNNQSINEAANSVNLNSGNYSKNDNLTCEITPFDGESNGTVLNSTFFSILNSAPLFNNTIANKAWDRDTSAAINLVNGFVDIDNDSLTYSYSDISNIAVSINNQTGVATLNPSSGFTGTRYIVFYASDGTNVTSSNNITLTVNDVAPPSSGGSSSSGSSGGGGGGGGGSNSGYQCSFNWKCAEWSQCIEGKEERDCKLERVPDFLSLVPCAQIKVPEKSRNCAMLVAEGSSELNQTEIENELLQNEIIPNQNPITGAVVGNQNGLSLNAMWLVFAIVLAILSVLFYGKYSHKRLFRKEDLSEEEMKKLNETLGGNIKK